MTSSLPARKRIELTAKLSSVQNEFDFWLRESEAGMPLQKHFSQIRATTAQIGDLANAIKATAPAEASAPDDWLSLERNVLELHRVWNYFRGKFAQRFVEPFRLPLAAADDLAWACYKPVQARAVEHGTVDEDRVKEPPLVFLNGGSSPMMSGRGKAFQAEAVQGEHLLTSQQLVEVLKRLPIPVIGVPWYQVEYLPDTLIVAHEVGHNIEEDLNLGPTLSRLVLDVVDAGRKSAWRKWLGEVFADVFGTLALGPAFVEALIDFLAQDVAHITTQYRSTNRFGLYPTDYLRVLIAVEVLKQREFDEYADLERRWTASYPRHAMPEFEPDIPRVVRAIIQGPYPELGKVGLADVPGFAFTAEDGSTAKSGVAKLKDNATPSTNDMRRLLATARLAFTDDPAHYAENGYHKILLARISEIQVGGVRHGRADEATRQVRDTGVGESLLDIIENLRDSEDELDGEDDINPDGE